MAKECYYQLKLTQALKKIGYQFMIIDTGISSTGKKPFDGILIRNGKVMAIEFKRDWRKLEDHQRASLDKLDAAAIVVRVMQDRKKNKEIIVSYPSGSVIFSTPLKYKVFASKFNLTFGVYFIKDKLSKYTVHAGAKDGIKKTI